MDPLIAAVAVAAVILAGLAKGGFAGVAMLSTPLLTLVFPPIQAAAILLPILVLQDTISIIVFRKSVDCRILAVLVPGAVLGIGLGYLFAAALSGPVMEIAIGAISIVFALKSLFIPSATFVPPKRLDVPLGLIAGALSGLTSMVAHAGAPPFQMYVLPKRLSRDNFIGTSAVFFAIVNWSKLPPFILLGQLTAANLVTSLLLSPIALASTLAGVWLVKRVDAACFFPVILILLVAVGFYLITVGLAGII